MNKKVLLTTTAMAMIAAMAVSADVNFSGSFEQGYVTSWTGSDYTVAADKDLANGDAEAEFDVDIADADGMWSVALANKNGSGDFFNDDNNFSAALTVDLAAGLATQGVELPMGLSYTIGNATDNTGLSVFNDDDQDSDTIKAIGGNSFMVVDATYGDMTAVQVAFSPITDKEALDLSAKVMPMDGVAMTAGWAYAIGDNAMVAGEDFTGAAYSSNESIYGGSFCVDVDQLADLGDYTVNTTGTLTYLVADGSNNDITNFAVNATVGYDEFSAYVQYAGTYCEDAFDAGTKDYNSALNTWVEYDGLANTTAQVYVNCLSLNFDAADAMEYGLTVDYTMGAITYEMNPELATAAGDDTFAITWNVQMDF